MCTCNPPLGLFETNFLIAIRIGFELLIIIKKIVVRVGFFFSGWGFGGGECIGRIYLGYWFLRISFEFCFRGKYIFFIFIYSIYFIKTENYIADIIINYFSIIIIKCTITNPYFSFSSTFVFKLWFKFQEGWRLTIIILPG